MPFALDWASTSGRFLNDMGSDTDEAPFDLFQEPSDYYQPEKEATVAPYVLSSGAELSIRLVGHNPLWVRSCLPLNHPSDFWLVMAR